MQEFQPSVTLYPKRSSIVGLLLVSAAFVTIGILMGADGKKTGYLVAAFFSLCLLVAIVQLVPGSSYLRLDQSGFTFSSLFRRTSILWSEVDEFFVVTVKQSGIGVHSMVGFNFVPSYDRARLGRRVASAIGKCEGALPDTYGKKAEELASYLNGCLANAKGADGEQEHAEHGAPGSG